MNGLNCAMVLGCFICKKERTFSSSENECEGRGKSAEINHRATLAATEVGLARDSLCGLLTILGTAPLVEAPSYNRHIATLSSLSQETSKDQKKKVAACLRQRAMDKDLTIRENYYVDVAVPYDGTWHRRGYTLNHGVGVVIPIDTGEIV
ncbi:uncharacterized protein LOC115919453 [Strongylocentrotus purpuratus]|uniref:Mutator-like transposase domain-containing protein n=1 Tax=Strongylocentrotus purpuratus TaxID=7668 RepID=A0A7M7N1B7_STRPU|nr:uncharacterized protein LOC115919453 [Strongylocentrotus purpuratus]